MEGEKMHCAGWRRRKEDWGVKKLNFSGLLMFHVAKMRMKTVVGSGL